MKTCIKCKNMKSFKKFHKDKTKYDGFKPYCKKCRVEDGKIYYQNNKSNKTTKYNKTEEYKMKKRIYDNEYKLQKKNLLLKNKYGINLSEFSIMLIKQNTKCKICENIFENKRDICVDHCHTSNKVRGLLCRKCNCALGLFNDNIMILRKAIEYIGEIK